MFEIIVTEVTVSPTGDPMRLKRCELNVDRLDLAAMVAVVNKQPRTRKSRQKGDPAPQDISRTTAA